MNKTNGVLTLLISGAALGICIGLCSHLKGKSLICTKNDQKNITNNEDEKKQIEHNKNENISNLRNNENYNKKRSIHSSRFFHDKPKTKPEELIVPNKLFQDEVLSNICSGKINPISLEQNDKIKLIKNIDKAPLELRKRFDKKGFVVVSDNLATINTEFNEFIELMRRYDLSILDGCKNPNTCSCNFRHKRCRLFMVRTYSDFPKPQFFVPTCSGVIDISPSNKDVQDDTTIHKFVQMFQNEFYDRINDLVNYISYVTDPNRINQFVVDITLIADPYDEYYKYEPADGGLYGHPKIIQTMDVTSVQNEIKHIGDQHKIMTSWHQDIFLEAKTNKTHAYDIVAMFLLNAHKITQHKLMIGKPKNEINLNGLSPDQIQDNIIPLSETLIDQHTNSDIGYIIDQRKNIFHRHTNFEYMSRDSRRNVITIRLKYLK